MSEIVVGYDGSDCSNAALDEACGLAKALGDKLVIVFGYAPHGYGGGEVPSHREAVEELADETKALSGTNLNNQAVLGGWGRVFETPSATGSKA